MNVSVRPSFSLFLSILRSPLLHCPHHHWATVEVVSGRGMMPNLTGVEPYLYSLHSRFCFKGFVYTRPINHLLPSHSPAAFKVGARLWDNVQHRCQRKSLFLLPLRKEMKIPWTLATFFPQLVLLCFTLPLDQIAISLSLQPLPKHFWLPTARVLHMLVTTSAMKSCTSSRFTLVYCLDVHSWTYTDWILLGVSINHTAGSHGQNGKWRTQEMPPTNAPRTAGSPP